MTRAFLRATVALLSVAIVVGPFAATGYSAAPSCAAIEQKESWTVIAAPSFSQGPAAITAYAIDPQAADTIFATNGQTLMRTTDGGCKWTQVFSIELLPSLDKPVSAANATIKKIAIPDGAEKAGARSIYLAVEEAVGPAVRPHVVSSHDGGDNWTDSTEGLPLVTGGVIALEAAPSIPKLAFLLVRDQPTGAADVVYASTNGGVSWEQRSQGNQGTANGLAINQRNADDVWFSGAELYHSTDGGRTREVIGYAAPPVPMLDVSPMPNGSTQVLAYEAETQSFMTTVNGGGEWIRIPGPGIFAHAMAHGTDSTQVVVAGHDGVYRLVDSQFWAEIHIEDQPDLFDLQATRSDESFMFGFARDENTIWRYDQLDLKVEVDPFTPVDVDSVSDVGTTLTPQHSKVKIDPGESKKVRYHLGLPPHPTALDVFFLVDTSQSMDSTINGLREGMAEVINELEQAKIDVQFGVGEFKDYPIPGYGNPESGDFPYRLDRKIGPADASLADALEMLDAEGGGNADKPESQLTGLYQAATGAGDPGFVAPGEDAGFRPGSLRVIIHLTDAAFHTDLAHPSPSWAEVVSALRSEAILQIGLAVYGREGPEGLDHLTDMAAATNALAPASGVDCTGDGTIDVQAGAPLACVVSDELGTGSVTLAPAIVSTLKAVTQDVRIELRAEESPRVGKIVPSVFPAYNVNTAGKLGFTVEYTCPRTLAGSRDEIELGVLVGGRSIAAADTLVVCRPLSESEEEKPAKVVPAVLPLVLPAALAPPPPAPPGVSETAPTTQQMFQAQPAAAAQEQEEVQAAVVWQEAMQQQAAEEYSFTAYRRPAPSGAPWILYGTAAAMAMAFAGLSLARGRALSIARSRR
ncbi:MAG TPA: vWA domain-containing protein [Actinomycetota bacterium]|nr:vWA domain-containing protein [Actinomycetota bacterium]